MCAPVAVVAVAMAASAAASGVAAKKAADANARAGRRNAGLAEDAASDALQRGEQDAAKVQRDGDAVVAQERVGFAAQGVDIASGSAAQVMMDTAGITAEDVQTVRNNAQREAWGLKTQAANMRADARDTSRAGAYALGAGIIGGVASGVSAAAGGFKGAGAAPGAAATPATPWYMGGGFGGTK